VLLKALLQVEFWFLGESPTTAGANQAGRGGATWLQVVSTSIFLKNCVRLSSHFVNFLLITNFVYRVIFWTHGGYSAGQLLERFQYTNSLSGVDRFLHHSTVKSCRTLNNLSFWFRSTTIYFRNLA